MGMRIERSLILNHIVSPYGIAVLSTIIFLIAWLFPPQLYTDLLDEPDLMFLDARTLLFFLLCVAGFWIGLLLVDFVLPSSSLLESKQCVSRLTGFFSLLLPLVLSTGMTLYVEFQMFKQSPNILTLLLEQQGGDLKGQMEANFGPLAWGATAQPVILWWTYWRLLRVSDIGRSRLRMVSSYLILAIGLIVEVALCVLDVSRSELMPVFAGLAIIYLLSKIYRREIGPGGLIRNLLFFCTAAIFIFYIVGLLRGSIDGVKALADFCGYTIASYNRLTALLNGTMNYPYGGHGVYLSSFLAYNHSVSTLFPLKEVLRWPEYLELWSSEFQAPQLAGLNPNLIWSGAFGYLFSDFGWVTPLILVPYGILYGILWGQMKSGTILGIILYPWFAFCALCWFSGNLAFDFRVPFFLLAGLLLMAYEKLLSMKLSGFRFRVSYPNHPSTIS